MGDLFAPNPAFLVIPASNESFEVGTLRGRRYALRTAMFDRLFVEGRRPDPPCGQIALVALELLKRPLCEEVADIMNGSGYISLRTLDCVMSECRRGRGDFLTSFGENFFFLETADGGRKHLACLVAQPSNFRLYPKGIKFDGEKPSRFETGDRVIVPRQL